MQWFGTARANSAVNLNPSALGITRSDSTDVHGELQVGYGFGDDTNGYHALLWNGTAASVIDLQTLLPSGFFNSQAYSIDDQGNIYGTAVKGSTDYVVEWTPVPEPSSVMLIGSGLMGLIVLKSRHRD